MILRLPLALTSRVLCALCCCAVSWADEATPLRIRRLPPPDAVAPSSNELAWKVDDSITPAQFTDGDIDTNTNSDSDTTLDSNLAVEDDFPEISLAQSMGQSFELDGNFEGVSARLDNNFTAFPEFAGGIVVVGDDIAMKIGGYIKADLIKDFDAIGSTDFFDTTTIPTSGPNRENARFHARQSRLSFDTRWHTEGDTVRAFVEADFFGGEPNNPTFRLRHAYGRVGRFTAGQTWTTFTDPSAVPQTLDREGGVSNVNRRQGLVRWDQPLWWDDLTIAVALEDPEVTVGAPSMLMGQGRTEFPDFITRVRLERDWGELRAAYVARTLGFQPVGEPVINEHGWGMNFTGSVFVLDDTKAYYQITFGDGIGSYRGSPDVVATGPNSAAIVGSFGWMVGVHHQWSDRWTSNLTFSKLTMEDVPGQDPDNLRRTTYLAVNLIANPYERVFCGVEYLFGIRQDASGAEGEANRLQFSFGFFLP